MDWLLILLAVICGLFYALLMLEQPFNVILSVPLIIAWLLFWITSRQFGLSAPLDLPILLLLVLASVGAFFTSFMELFLPKLSGLIIGVSFYYIITAFFRYRQRLPAMITALLFLSVIVGLLGLVGTDWPVGNHVLFDRIYRHLPAIFDNLGVEAINKNTLGGVLASFPPLLLSLLWDKGGFGRLKSHYEKLSAIPEFVYKGFVAFCFIFCSGILLLTQSRGAWLGCAAGIFLLCVFKDKRFLWVLFPTGMVFLYFLFFRSEGNLLQLISLLDTSQEATLPGRFEIWSKALLILRDFPLTGIGLGAFGEVYQQYFASIVLPSSADVVYHAHNTMLSVAVEVGIPGLLAYSILIGGFGAMSWKMLTCKRTINRVLAIGLACGIFSFLVYGLFDAFTLGRNLEIIYWIFLGCASALYVHDYTLSSSEVSYDFYQENLSSSKKDPAKKKQTRKQNRFLVVYWLVIALIALALVGLNVVLALMISIVSGVGIGVYYVRAIEEKHYETA